MRAEAVISKVLLTFLDYHPLFSFPSSCDLEPYMHQVELYYKLILRKPIRVLIADEIGLGKTIEAGMIVKSLMEFGRKNVLVLVPRALVTQWDQELRRMGISNVTVDFNTFENLGSGVLVFKIDTAKRERMSRRIFNIKWDTIVVDECHRVGLVGGVANQRYELVESLIRKCPEADLIMLSATPHRGKDDDYLQRIRLIDSNLNAGERLSTLELYKCMRDAIVFRRTKEDVNEIYEGENIFTRARLIAYLVPPTEEELKYHERITQLTRAILLECYHRTGSKPRALGLLMATVEKRALSSPISGLKTFKTIVDNRKHVLSEGIELESEVSAYLEDEEFLAEGDPDDLIYEYVRSNANLVPEEFVEPINELVDLADSISKNDSRLETVAKIANTHFRQGEKIVVFTEYKDTAEYVAKRLRKEFEEDRVLLVTGEILGSGRLTVDQIKKWLSKEGARIMVSTDVVSEGLNLQQANVLIHYEPPWTPLRMEQRLGRVWRLGQKKDVVAYTVFLATENEKTVFNVIYEKLMAWGRAKLSPRSFSYAIVDGSGGELVIDFSNSTSTPPVEIREKDGGRKRLTYYTLWEELRRGGVKGLERLVETFLSELNRMSESLSKLEMDKPKRKIYTENFLSNIVGFRSRRNLKETALKILKPEGNVANIGSKVIKLDELRQHLIGLKEWANHFIQRERVGESVLVEGYDREIHVFNAKISSNSSPEQSLNIPVGVIIADNSKKFVLGQKLLDEVVSACGSKNILPANEFMLGNVDDARTFAKTNIKMLGDHILGNFIEYRRKTLEMGVRDADRWSPKSVDDVNVEMEHVLSIIGAKETVCQETNVPARTLTPEEKERIEKEAMKVAIKYEEMCGRRPVDVSACEHYDILSQDREGKIRYIEVKGHAGRISSVEITEEEYNVGKRFAENYWLYIVFEIDSGKPQLLAVKNPLKSMKITELVKKRYLLTFGE